MFIRNYKNKLVQFHIHDYATEKQLYTALWKIKYNIAFAKKRDSFNISLYVKK